MKSWIRPRKDVDLFRFHVGAGHAPVNVVVTALSGFDFLRLRLQSDGTGGKRLKRVRVGATSGFDWSCQTETWRTYVGLIGGLFDYGRPSHQYLTEEGDDDALVEVAFMETGPTGTG